MRKKWEIVLILAMMLIFVSCSSVPELNVLYRLPKPTPVLQGKSVVLEVIDSRGDKDILSPRARKEFPGFVGNLSYSVARYGEKGFKIGVFDLKEVLIRSLKQRLEATGLNVLKEPKPSLPKLRIYINQLQLDLVGRRWIATMNYDANLEIDGRVAAKQSISGKAERAKTIGKKGADKVFAEIFTDTINSLNVVKLFRDARIL